MLRDVEAFFSSEGPLAKRSGHYRYRKEQVEMAKRIATHLKKGDQYLVVEASTGTGKSFAYLAAALLSGKRSIVSTATRTLQDQLYTKDLPVVIRAASELSGKRYSALMLKGRNNYVCLKKVDERGYHEGSDALVRWAKKTDTGDFAELESLAEDSPLLAAFDARSEHCVGQACSFYNECFVVRMRREAQKVDLLVVNHALMCTDAAIRAKSAQAQEDTELSEAQNAITSQILPDFDLWIIDEAHAFSDVATRNFGISLGDKDMRQLANDLLYITAFLAKNVQDELKHSAIEIAPAFKLFVERFVKEGRSSALAQEAFFALLEALRALDVSLIQALSQEGGYAAELKMMSRRVHELIVQLSYVCQGAAEKNGYLVVAENDSRGSSLAAWPIHPGAILKTHMWDLEVPVVMTSATLAFNGNTEAFKQQMGLEALEGADDDSLILPPIFDFENRAALYVAKHLPNPNEPAFGPASHDEILSLIEMTRGGALVLFTSHRALNEAYFALRDVLTEKGLRVFKQGDAPKLALIREFVRADDIDGAVLFATHSFWEGVDIPGRALRMVIIDRLPFHSVSDPLYEARMRAFDEEKGGAFQKLALPDAALTLKQGFGRLLRSHSDAGLAVLLDSRAVTKGYGRQILKALPPMPLFVKHDDVERVWQHHLSKLLGAAHA